MDELNEEEMKGIEGGACPAMKSFHIEKYMASGDILELNIGSDITSIEISRILGWG